MTGIADPLLAFDRSGSRSSGSCAFQRRRKCDLQGTSHYELFAGEVRDDMLHRSSSSWWSHCLQLSILSEHSRFAMLIKAIRS